MRFFSGLPFEIRPYSRLPVGLFVPFLSFGTFGFSRLRAGPGRSALRSFGRAGARGIPVCVSVLCCIHKKDTCGKHRRYLLTSRVLARESVSVLFHLFSYFVECGERHFHQLHLRLLVAFVAVGFCGRLFFSTWCWMETIDTIKRWQATGSRRSAKEPGIVKRRVWFLSDGKRILP